MGLGIEAGSKPGPGSRTTMSIPRAWSHATQHSTCLEGSWPLPCSIALASASRSASSISNSRPAAQPIWVTISITLLDDGRDGVDVGRQRHVDLDEQVARLELAASQRPGSTWCVSFLGGLGFSTSRRPAERRGMCEPVGDRPPTWFGAQRIEHREVETRYQRSALRSSYARSRAVRASALSPSAARTRARSKGGTYSRPTAFSSSPRIARRLAGAARRGERFAVEARARRCARGP